MTDILIVKLEQFLETVNITLLIQLFFLVFWILLVKILRIDFRISLIASLSLVFLSMVLSAVGLNLAWVFPEFAFIFLSTGIVQIILSSDRSESKAEN